MKKGVEKLGVIISLAILISIFVLNFVSATTESHYPTSGKDTTGNETYIMDNEDLDKVSTSDNDRYVSYGPWSQVYYGSMNIEWEFSPKINSKAEIKDVKLKFEWQRDAWVDGWTKVSVWDDDADEWVNNLYLQNPTAGNDVTEIIDLESYGINTINDVNNLKIKFQARDISQQRTKHDLVELKIEYSLDEDAPACSIDYLEQKDSHNIYNLASSEYINEDGRYYINGNSIDAQSKIANAQYNRTSPNTYLTWTDADPVDGAFNELAEDWRSDPNDNEFIEGLHNICCRATDEKNNQGAGTCKSFCIDKEAPVMDSIIDNTKDCSEDSKYSSSDEITWRLNAHDVGCADIDYYIVKLYKNDDLVGTLEISGNEKTFSELSDGKTYYIIVTPLDKAGNQGNSMQSDSIIIDLTDPSVEITSPEEGSWFKNDFVVSETDSDENLLECQIEIQNNENEPYISDWDSELCNADFNLILDSYCSQDGTCKITKTATDKACRESEDSTIVNIDKTSPIVSKEVGEPKIEGRSLLDIIIDWFITDETKITLDCDDGDGSGIKEIKYKINDGEWTQYTEPFSLGEDGIYDLEYYCTDNVNMESEHKFETDKVDTQAPGTIKTIGEPKYWDEEKEQWCVSENTLFTLTCNDEEVGCDGIHYEIDEGGKQTYESPFNLKGLKGGEHAIYYYSADLLGNSEEADSEQDWLDANEPTITDDYEDGWKNTDQLVTLAPDDVGCGIKEVKYCLGEDCDVEGGAIIESDYEIEFNGNQDTILRYQAWDNVGYASLIGEEEIKIDTTAPVTTSSFTSSEWQNDDIITNLSCEDPEVNGAVSGCEWTKYCIDSENTCEPETKYAGIITYGEEGIHYIRFFSKDYANNEESVKIQIIKIDKSSPRMILLNPTEEEAENVQKCAQSVVAIVSDGEGSGIKRVWAELWDGKEKVREAEMKLTLYGTYEALIDKQLPAGEYLLKVYAQDNAKNNGTKEQFEVLKEGVFVEYIEDPICKINPEVGGTCNFTFNICMRNGNSIKMWMDKLGQVVTPGMMNATISKGENSSYVALWADEIDSELLTLDNEIINGRIKFDLSLNVPSDVASMIGVGAHKLDYLIRAYSPELPE